MPTKLGQNFLKNSEIIEQIISSANLTSNDTILEIGPGEGILTEALAKNAQQIFAIELDQKLIPSLQSKFANTSNISIVHNDILKINIPELLQSKQIKKYKVIANIPYYITSKIIRLFLESPAPPIEIILMVQKEVAERIVAQPGKMSKLAVSVQYYAQPEILFTVGKENFEPIPKVDSAVIKIGNIKKKSNSTATKNFFRIVRAGFCARRKTLANNLSNSLHLSKQEVFEKLKSTKISPTTRAQELSIKEWKFLARIF